MEVPAKLRQPWLFTAVYRSTRLFLAANMARAAGLKTLKLGVSEILSDVLIDARDNK
jgi:hypothetical protein